MRKLLTFLIALGAIVFGVCSPAVMVSSAFAQTVPAAIGSGEIVLPMTGDCASPPPVSFNTPPVLKCYGSPTYHTGMFYIGGQESMFALVSNSTTGSNLISCYPGHLFGSATLVYLGARINTVSAGGNLGLAIYANNSSVWPNQPTGTPLVQSASLSTATAGEVSTTVSYTFTPTATTVSNTYAGTASVWFCSMMDNGTSAANGIQINPNAAYFSGSSTASSLQSGPSNNGGVTYSNTFSSGWPDLTSASPTFVNRNFVTVKLGF